MEVGKICGLPIIRDSGFCREPSVEEVEERIEKLEEVLNARGGKAFFIRDSHYDNKMRVELARLYVQTGRNEEATTVLETALASPSTTLIYNLIYNYNIPYVPEYFEILLGLAEAYKSVDIQKSSEYADRVIKELKDGRILAAQQVKSSSVAELRSRALAIKAGK